MMMLLYSLLLALILLALSYFYFQQQLTTTSIKRKSSTGSLTILLIGPLNSGKTSIFSNLLYGTTAKTHTSMKENEGAITTKWILSSSIESEKESTKLIQTNPIRPLHLVDIPGHPRLRTRSLTQFLPTADGLIFVIDGMNGLSGKNVQETGEHLHILLSLLTIHSINSPSSPPLPLLILLTKSDLVLSSSRRPTATSTTTSGTSTDSKTLSLSLERAKQSLAREMERRRVGSSGGTNLGGNSRGRLEGLEPVTSALTISSTSNPLKMLWKSLTNQNTTSTSIGIVKGLPIDESEILEEDAFPFEGSFDWDKLGLDIKWDWSSNVGSNNNIKSIVQEKNKDSKLGTEGIWNWIEEVVL